MAKKKIEAELIKIAKDDIRRSFRAGRDVFYIAREHHCKEFLVLQLNLRELTSRVINLETALMQAARTEAS